MDTLSTVVGSSDGSRLFCLHTSHFVFVDIPPVADAPADQYNPVTRVADMSGGRVDLPTLVSL